MFPGAAVYEYSSSSLLSEYFLLCLTINTTLTAMVGTISTTVHTAIGRTFVLSRHKETIVLTGGFCEKASKDYFVVWKVLTDSREL